MIRHLYIENFKCWSRLDAPIAPLTGLFGANSSGKTSILQFLLMLKQTKNATDRGLTIDFGDPNSLVNLGNFTSVIHGHDQSKVISWALEWSLTEKLVIADPAGMRTSSLFSGDNLRMRAVAGLRQGSLASLYLDYRFSNMRFLIEPKKEGDTQFRLGLKTEEGATDDQKAFSFTRTQGRAWQLPRPIKSYAFPDQAKTYYQNADFLSKFELEFEKLMDRIYYLGPLRDHPQREYTWSGTRPTDVGQRGEKVVDALLAARSREEMRNLAPRKRIMHFEAIIGHWLAELGVIDSFRIDEIGSGSNLYRVLVRRSAQSSEVLITDVGFGVSQILPVLVLLYYVPENSIILLEQPEIHLHPSVQSGLADVIINVVNYRNIQVIVESHSEHLLRRLQRRCAEAILPNDRTQLFFCGVRNGKSVLTPLELNLYGEIENWPDNFFGDDFGEIAAAQKAALERKLKAKQ